MATRIQHGSITLRGSNKVSISYSGFSSTPSVTATVMSTKNGATVRIDSVGAGGATLQAFYNGGLRLTSGTIYWIAIGPTGYSGFCGCGVGGHTCTVCKVFD